MTFENTAVALAKIASQSLRDLDQHGPQTKPHGADRFAWSADVLDELARAAELIGQAVEHTTGAVDADITRRARELATAVVAHRNALLCGERGERWAGEGPQRRDHDEGRAGDCGPRTERAPDDERARPGGAARAEVPAGEDEPQRPGETPGGVVIPFPA